MVNSLRLMEISKKWQVGGSKVTSPSAAASSLPSPAAACPRGHFAAYTRDGSRFFVPIACLAGDTFRHLLNMAEEEFGTPGGDRPIVFPCSAACLDRILAEFKKSGGGGRTKLW